MNLQNYLTANGKYPDRAKHTELTPELLKNADMFILGVNNFLKEIGIDPAKVIVSSGFRPSDVNAKVAGSAKKSLHMQCKAVDFVDVSGELYKKATEKPELLRKYGLFVEDRSATPSWLHLDIGVRADRPSRIFKP